MTEFAKLSREDIPKCEDIYFEAFEVPVRLRFRYDLPDYFSVFMDDKDKYACCVKEDGEVRGFLLSYNTPSQFGDKTFYISDLAVDVPYQKKGFGKFLLTSFLEKYGSDAQINLMTKRELPAHKLYEALEFGDTEYVFMSRLSDTTRSYFKTLKEQYESLRNENKQLSAELERLLKEKE